MLCDFDNAGVCTRCLEPQAKAGYLRNCCGTPRCFDDPAAFSHLAADIEQIDQHAVPSGPGAELSKILKTFGIEPTPTCKCRAMAATMNAWGPDECSKPERIEQVVAVMREEAHARGLPFLDGIGRMLVRRAIKNARKANASS